MSPSSRPSPFNLITRWFRLPERYRWGFCVPLLVAVYVVTFQLSALVSDVTLQNILRLHWSPALVISPILADMIHLTLMLPAIRILVPSRQHLVFFGLATVMAVATMLGAYDMGAALIVAGNWPDPARLWHLPDSLGEWRWRPVRDLVNTIIVLTVTIWYVIRLRRRNTA